MLLKRQAITAKELLHSFKRLSAILMVLCFVFSCSDQGCIEADDFGEYDTQTLEVTSNNSADNCTYDVSKSLTDASQGSGLKTCFISGSVTIYDENDIPQTSSTGCTGLPSAKYKNLCVSQCVANCNANIGIGSPTSAEPAWASTSEKNGSQNGGVTIKPNSTVYIRAIGSVRLGDKLPFPDFFVAADDIMPQSKTANWSSQNLDLKSGKAISISFSGRITDDSVINGGTASVGQVGGGASSALDSKVYNAGRRLAAYILPAPAGFAVDPSQPTEKAQFINVPLLPDHNLWQCAYSGASLKQSTCSNKSYRNNGYPNVDDVLVGGTFPVSSDMKTTTLGRYGGMIRWDADGIEPDSADPFAGILCENPNCSAASIDSSRGVLVGDLSTRDVVIASPTAAKVSFRELLLPSNGLCDDNLQIIIRDANDRDLYYFDGTHGSTAVPVSSSAWSPTQISVEAGHKVVIRQRLARSYTHNSDSISCDRALALKFAKYQDIAIDQSGFVSFALLGGLTNAGCIVKARIINPAGRHSDVTSTITADFYEYADFAHPGDPLDNLVVPALSQTAVWQDGSGPNNGSLKVFVRKGQVIRFSPESWNNTWAAAGGARECGIGMAMRLEPRPALLCRGHGSSDVPNPTCTPKYNGSDGALVGCDEIAAECSDSTNSTYYCPNQSITDGCLQPVTCANGTAVGLPNNVPPIPKNTRYSCSLGTRPSGCTIPTGSGATYSATMCSACSQLRKIKAEQSPYLSISNVAQCYDLEAYAGKVSNIPISGFSEAELSDPSRARGASILEAFNGDYGNLAGFGGDNKVDTAYGNNIIFQVTQPINVSRSGRLKFLFLDGTDFHQGAAIGYNDNNPSTGARYNGSNGFKISLTSALEFNNGEWLEAKICQELPNDTLSCKNITVSPAAAVSGAPKIVELNDPTGTSLVPVSNTPFYFDNAGNLIRSRAAVGGDCIGVLIRDTYYCHTNSTLNPAKIRLTFKIKDPEAATCDTNSPTTTNPAAPNGILVTNPHFRPSDCVVGNPSAGPLVPRDGITIINSTTGASSCVSNLTNAGARCLAAEDNPSATPPTVCQKEFRCLSKYGNNSGKYYVTVRVKTPGSNLSNIVNDVITPVVTVMDGSRDGATIGQAERIYKMLITDPRYQAILSISLVVMFTFYGFGYLIGVTESGASDIISKLIKISLIYLFVGPEGWYWFNAIVVKFFKNGTDYLAFVMASSFDTSTALQNAIQNSDFYDKSILFGSVDRVFGIFFSSTVQKKISALLFASIFGWAYLLLIYYGMLLYVYAVANSVLLYLTSQVFISILFVLGPLFFIFTLFAQTKEMFDKWLSQLISFSLQQVFLLTTLAFFNMMMYEVIKMVLGYKICWDEVWTINIITRITLMSFWTIASLPPRVNSQSDAGNIGNPDGIPSFFTILFIWVIADLMLKFVEFMTNMAASISGGLKASSLGAGIKGGFESIGKFAGARASEVWDKSGGQALRKLDQSLFDSGRLADQARDKQRQENSQNAAHKKAFVNAGNSAVSDYKRKNGAELSTLSKEDQEKALTKVRNEAVAKEGAKRGLSADQIDKLQKDKGFKSNGTTNVFGFAAQLAKQGLSKGGSLRTSIADQKVKTKFSGSEARDAIKNADADGRRDFVKAVKEGGVVVGKSGAEAFKSGIKMQPLRKGIAAAAKAIGKAVHDKEYDEARDQLVAEGVVPKMAAGTYSALPKEAKEKIRARAAQNKKEKGLGKKKISSANTAAKMEQYAAAADERESAGDGYNVREEGAVSAIIGRDKDIGMAWNRDSMAKKIKAERAAAEKPALKKAQLKAEDDMEKADEEYHKHEDKVQEILSDPDFKKNTEESGELSKVIADRNAPREVRSEARKRLAEIKSDPKFKEQSKQLKEASVGRNEAFNKKKNFEEAANMYEDKIAAIEEQEREAFGSKVKKLFD